MRIVSLAPNITKILVDLEMREEIVGVTDVSDFSNAKNLGKWLTTSVDQVENLNPDIVFTSDNLQDKIFNQLKENDFIVNHTEPTRLYDLFPLIYDIGTTVGKVNKANEVVEENERRLKNVLEQTQSKQPTVWAEEWDTPPMVAGNWVPDMIDIAGGEYPFVNPGTRSRKADYTEFRNSNIDIMISHICGQGLQKEHRDIRDDWNTSDIDVYFVNDMYINQLSTRTIVGVEILKEIISNKDYGHTNKYTKFR